jgi:glycosyltransferase involved in cell wall biosynthesis
MDKLFIVIPAHNEEKRLSITLDKYIYFFEDAVKTSKLKEYEILIVINNTTDKTLDIVKEYQKLNTPLHYLDLKPGGKGFAVLEGFKEALKGNSDYIGFVDADCSTEPDEFFRLACSIKDEDGIIASRYLPGSLVNPKQSIQRIIVSRIFNKMIHFLFPSIKYKDTQCGAKIFKRKVIESIIDKISITQWAFDLNLLYEINKVRFKIKEEPTKWSDNKYSKLYLKKAGPRMVLSLIRLRLNNSRFKFVADFYDNLPIWLKVSHLI